MLENCFKDLNLSPEELSFICELAMNRLDEGVVIVNKDHVITGVNNALLGMLGYSSADKDKFEGKEYSEIFGQEAGTQGDWLIKLMSQSNQPEPKEQIGAKFNENLYNVATYFGNPSEGRIEWALQFWYPSCPD